MERSVPMIELRNVRKTYGAGEGETHALYEVSLTIGRGEFVAIMGPSGSGKSTLMHILGFLDTPTAGDYRFMGATVSGLSDDALAGIRSERVSFIFQAFNLLPRTSVAENVALPLLYRSDVSVQERARRTTEAIRTVGLEDRAEHLSNQLSGGQQQRVAIARALVTRPDIIFADEPTGNLDSASGIAVMRTLHDLHERGHTIILVTHEQETAWYADRIITIRDGRIASDERNSHRKRTKNTSPLK